jgi:hypothetical protein
MMSGGGSVKMNTRVAQTSLRTTQDNDSPHVGCHVHYYLLWTVKTDGTPSRKWTLDMTCWTLLRDSVYLYLYYAQRAERITYFGVGLGYDLDGSPYKDQPTLTLDWLLKRTWQLEPRAAYPFDRRKE